MQIEILKYYAVECNMHFIKKIKINESGTLNWPTNFELFVVEGVN